MIVWYCNNKKCQSFEREVGNITYDERCAVCGSYLKMKSVKKSETKKENINRRLSTEMKSGALAETVTTATDMYPQIDANDYYDDSKKRDSVYAFSDMVGNGLGVKEDDKEHRLHFNDKQNEAEEYNEVNDVDFETEADDSNEANKLDEDVEMIVAECFLEHGVIGMGSVKQKIDTLYKIFNHENTKGVDVSIMNKHFFIAGGYRCGKSLLTDVMASLLNTLGDRDKEVKIIDIDLFFEMLASYNEDKIDEVFKDCDNKVVAFNDNLDSIFKKEDNSVDIPVAKCRIIRRVLTKLSGTCNVVLTGSKFIADDLYGGDDYLKECITRIDIDDYDVEETLSIVEKVFEDRNIGVMDDEAKKYLKGLIGRTSFNEERTIGNFIDELVTTATERQARRITNLDNMGEYPTDEERTTFVREDFEESCYDEDEVNKLIDELNSMIGLSKVKEEVKDVVAVLEINKKQRDIVGKSSDISNLNMIFAGDPGTGKTTVARMIAKIYNKLGLLKHGDIFVEKRASDLISDHEGGTEQRVREVFKSAEGGVLFIDEAHNLADSNYGNIAIKSMVPLINERGGELMVIIAGYENKLNKFLEKDPGLPRRFPRTIHFERYSTKELMQIFDKMISDKDYHIEDGMTDKISSYLDKLRRKENFGNAGEVKNLVDGLIECSKARVAEIEDPDDAEFFMIREADMDKYLGKMNSNVVCGNGINEEHLDKALEELNGLIGLSQVKNQIRDMVDSERGRIVLRENGIDIGGESSYNMCFVGNAGTGKTTVAKIVGKIYGALGILARSDVFVECKGAEDLIAEYEGQTLGKVKEKINQAKGGILFIDEAYSLLNAGTYGKQAIDTLVSEIEGRGGELMVVLAGYEEDIRMLMEANQGMSSRFPSKITFEDYDDNELASIFKVLLKNKKFVLDNDTDDVICDIVSTLRDRDDFGNGRSVRNLVDVLIRQRVAKIGRGEIKGDMLNVITKEDLYEFKL